MSFFSKLFGADKSQEEAKSNVNASRSESAVSLRNRNNEGEIVAVIMAALMNMLSDSSAGELRIKSIRRTDRRSPVWNVAGRNEYIASKL
ncbi:MAG: OadG family protein [Acetivibrionales bacterium]